jgi:hypothetical protein
LTWFMGSEDNRLEARFPLERICKIEAGRRHSART